MLVREARRLSLAAGRRLLPKSPLGHVRAQKWGLASFTRGGPVHELSPEGVHVSRLTPRWSGRVEDKVPSSNAGVRAAQLNR
jgi:hypothetical protein